MSTMTPRMMPGKSQSNDAPIITRGAAAASFPSVHPFAEIGVFAFDEYWRTGLEQIFLRGKEFIIGERAPHHPVSLTPDLLVQ